MSGPKDHKDQHSAFHNKGLAIISKPWKRAGVNLSNKNWAAEAWTLGCLIALFATTTLLTTWEVQIWKCYCFKAKFENYNISYFLGNPREIQICSAFIWNNLERKQPIWLGTGSCTVKEKKKENKNLNWKSSTQLSCKILTTEAEEKTHKKDT